MLSKFGFTTSKAAKRKKDEYEKKDCKKKYERKREHVFLTRWTEQFPGLQYEIASDEASKPNTSDHEQTTVACSGGDETASSASENADSDFGVMYCKVCREYSDYTDKSSSLFLGTSKFRKDTLTAHWKSLGHKRCFQRKQLCEKTEQNSTGESVGPIVDMFRRVDQNTEEKIKKIIKTVYCLCKNEWSFSMYPKLLLLQEINGM